MDTNQRTLVFPPDSHLAPPHVWDVPTFLVMIPVHLGALLAPWTFSWSGLWVGVAMYIVTAGGITIGFHRLLTHRSYKTSKWLEYVFTLCGTLACQGGPISWTVVHRLHHKHSDDAGDPHSARTGFWWSHMGWMFVNIPRKVSQEVRERITPDLMKDPVHRTIDRHMLTIAVMSGALLFHFGGWSWLVYGMFLRLTLVYHATWLVNSAAHKFGYRTHATRDLSTNCWWVALLTFGEGWHNNHHAFPRSARHGLGWWELDLTFLVISGLEKLGLVWDVHLPKGHRK